MALIISLASLVDIFRSSFGTKKSEKIPLDGGAQGLIGVGSFDTYRLEYMKLPMKLGWHVETHARQSWTKTAIPKKPVLVMNPTSLRQIHEDGSWKGCDLRQVYDKRLELEVNREVDRKLEESGHQPLATPEEATSKGAERNPSSVSVGITQADGMITWTTDGAREHAVLVCEIKAVPGPAIASEGEWKRKHKRATTQCISYLYATYTLCGARYGLIIVNYRFQCIVISGRGACC